MGLFLQPPQIRESLTGSLAEIGSARRLALLIQASAVLLVAITLPTLVFCLLDVLWALPTSVRAAGLILTLIVGTGLFRRYWLVTWRLTTDPLAVALQLEQVYPQLHDTLASGVAFARSCVDGEAHPAQGFRAAVIRAARRLLERHDFSTWIPRKSATRATWLALAVMLIAGAMFACAPHRAAQALIRFVDPFGAHPWPTRTHIDILEPHPLPVRLARGESWSLVFAVSGELPEYAEVEILQSDGEHWIDHYPLSRDAVHQAAAPVSIRWDGQRFRRSFQFRIHANDASTPWHHITLVAPPQFLPLDDRPSPQFRIIPPPYCGLPAADLPDGAAVLEVPIGSVVHLRARCDTSLTDARLVFAGPPPPLSLLSALQWLAVAPPPQTAISSILGQAYAADIPLQLNAEGTLIHGVFQPPFSGTYIWKLTDTTGLTCTRLLEVRLLPDPTPTVHWTRPQREVDPPWYLPTAALALHVSASDSRYGLRQTTIEYRCQGEHVTQQLHLFDGELLHRAFPALVGTAVCARPWHNFRCERHIPLAIFRHADGRPLQDGDIVHLRIQATDWDNITPCKPPGYTTPHSDSVEPTPIPGSQPEQNWDFTLAIVSQQTLLAILQRELASLLPDSQQLRRLHQQAQQLLSTPRTNPTPPDNPSASPLREQLFRLEQLQRQLRNRMEHPQDGLVKRVERLRTTAQVNRLPTLPLTRRLQAVGELVQQLHQQQLPALDTHLWQLREAIDLPIQEERRLALQRQQQVVEQQLQTLVELLSEWSGAADVRSQARLLQQQIVQQTAELQRLSEQVPAGQPIKRLPPEAASELQRHALRLQTSAEQTATLLGQAARMSQQRQWQAEQARKLAEAAERRSQELQQQTTTQAPGSHDRALLEAQAASQRFQAAEFRRQAQQAQAEAAALHRALQLADGQAAATDLRQAAEQLRQNQQSQAIRQTTQAAQRLEQFMNALTTEQQEDAPVELSRRRAAADALHALGDAQEDLYRRTQQAAQLADAHQRSAELHKLARQQTEILEQAQQLLQRLQRDGSSPAMEAARNAVEQMAVARDALHNGQAPLADQARSLQQLDEARDRLDMGATTTVLPQHLADEKHRQLTDRLRTLIDRQNSRITEAQRLHERLLSLRRWVRTLEHSYAALAEDERQLAEEIHSLIDTLDNLPVLQHVLEDATAALRRAAERIDQRLTDRDRERPFDDNLETHQHHRLLVPMTQAVRRLELILSAIKEDKQTQDQPAAPKDPHPTQPPSAIPSGGDIVSLRSQLKVLRTWQAEILQRTAELAQRYPNPTTAPESYKEQLHELQTAQRTIATLFEKLAPRLVEDPTSPLPDASPLPVAPPPRPLPEDTPPHQSRATPDARRPQSTPHVASLNISIVAILSMYLIENEPIPIAPPPRPAPLTGPSWEPKSAQHVEDPAQIVERIIRQARQASQELARANTGPQTQLTQQHILVDIDKLLQPPPSGQGQSRQGSSESTSSNQSSATPSPPSTGQLPPGATPPPDARPPQSNSNQSMPPTPNSHQGSAPSAPKGSSTPATDMTQQSASAIRRPRRDRSSSQTQASSRQQATDSTTPDVRSTQSANPQTPPSSPNTAGVGRPDSQKQPRMSTPRSMLTREEEWILNIWGHLPDTLRRQASEYFRQELIPQYSKLLEKYYSSRLEKNNK
jgi:hypothetical protein